MRKIKMPVGTTPTTDVIIELLNKHQIEHNRILKMKRYYKNHNDIMDRNYTDYNKPMNKLSHPYCSYITNTVVGYFLGKPVAYKSDNQALLEKLQDNFMYNDEADINTTLAKEVSICGYAYEILYNDSNAITRFACVDTENTIVVYDNTLEENIMFAIRYYYVDDETEHLEVYTDTEIIRYEKIKNSIKFIDQEVHHFKEVPVVDYVNNNDRMGDFESVISLIDAYDKANSDTANDFEYFTNALLVISGIVMDDDDNENPLDFKNNRVLNFASTDSKAEYLIKDINDTALENYKNRLDSDIHKFAQVPNISDENFVGNASGVAMKYKLQGLENLTAIKEAKFRKGLMRRIEILTNIFNIKLNDSLVYTEIKPVFTRNIPANETELVTMAKNLYGIVSEDTLLSLLPFIDDVGAEKEAILREKENQAVEYELFGSVEDDTE